MSTNADSPGSKQVARARSSWVYGGDVLDEKPESDDEGLFYEVVSAAVYRALLAENEILRRWAPSQAIAEIDAYHESGSDDA